MFSYKPSEEIKIGSIYDDLKCIKIYESRDRENPYYGTDKGAIYIMKCIKCGRIKSKFRYQILRHEGTSHKYCGQYTKRNDMTFYRRWQSMRDRTTNINKPEAHRYVNRGINSDAWVNFIDFYDDMYESWCEVKKYIPEKYISLERIDNNKPYCKENCRWIHFKDQYKNNSKNNRLRITNLQTGDVEYIKCAADWCRRKGLYPRLAECAIRTKTGIRNGYKFEIISDEEYLRNRSISETFNTYALTDSLRVNYEFNFDNADEFVLNDIFINDAEKIGETEFIFKNTI